MRPKKGLTLRVRGIDFGAYSSVRSLNPNFARDSALAKISIEIDAGPDHEAAFRRAVATLVSVCPALTRHTCSVGGRGAFLEGTGNLADDFAHLLEHLIVELSARLSPLPRVSGATCGRRSPANHYDIFVECERAPAGEFAIRLACWALVRAARDRVAVPDLHAVLRAFRAAERQRELLRSPDDLRRAARLSPQEARRIIDLLVTYRAGEELPQRVVPSPR